jgi:hypothetical protein
MEISPTSQAIYKNVQTQKVLFILSLNLIATKNEYVTYRPIARQQLGKHTPAGANTRNNRRSIARQRISKQVSLTTEAVFPAWSVQSGYKEVFSSRVSSEAERCV